ncbi:MAG: hypothetical protein LRS46_04035 [Desulfurococcales archaeon]|nr:hypothetical protein [Desulfurococcales archaeon]
MIPDKEGEKKSEAAEVDELLPDKVDIKVALSAIPPASALKARERRLSEKRIRLRYDPSLEREEAKINPQLARELGITDKLEVVVAGRHRFVFRAIIDEDVDYNRVHVNPELMEENGVADNSIATVRSYRGTERLGVRLEV